MSRPWKRQLEDKKKKKTPIIELLTNSPKQVLCGFLSLAGHQVNGYALSMFSLSYMANALGMPKSHGLMALMIAVTGNTLMTPVMGKLADRFGTTAIFSFGAIFLFAFAFPLFWLLGTGSIVLGALIMTVAYSIGHGATSGAQGAFLANASFFACPNSGNSWPSTERPARSKPSCLG